jgi:DNA/RNA endonuclease YhcR with UshA esterase domain
MRFLCFILVLFLSCNKDDYVKVENVFDKKDSTTEASKETSSYNVKEKKRITTSEAAINVGREVILTGYVAEVNIRNKVAYLNFDNKYPKHTFTGVIFASNYGKFGDLSIYEKKNVELTGIVNEYNKKPQIILNSPGQIKIKE